MSLTINVDACENSDELRTKTESGGEGRDYVTWDLALLMRHIGIPRISVDLAGASGRVEFMRRVRLLELAWGPQTTEPGGKPRNFTTEDVDRRAGMYTNWLPKTRAKFDREVKEEWQKKGGEKREEVQDEQ